MNSRFWPEQGEKWNCLLLKWDKQQKEQLGRGFVNYEFFLGQIWLEISVRHPSGNVHQAIGAISLELWGVSVATDEVPRLIPGHLNAKSLGRRGGTGKDD